MSVTGSEKDFATHLSGKRHQSNVAASGSTATPSATSSNNDRASAPHSSEIFENEAHRRILGGATDDNSGTKRDDSILADSSVISNASNKSQLHSGLNSHQTGSLKFD